MEFVSVRQSPVSIDGESYRSPQFSQSAKSAFHQVRKGSMANNHTIPRVYWTPVGTVSVSRALNSIRSEATKNGAGPDDCGSPN